MLNTGIPILKISIAFKKKTVILAPKRCANICQKKGAFMQEMVVLVDRDDNEIGVEEKILAHKKGLLHRSFSIFVFDDKNNLLIQKRSKNKYHSAGLWSNTCCSHPRPGEDLELAVHRRLREEMGFDCPLEKKFIFYYKIKFDNGLFEHENDHIFVGQYQGLVDSNELEVEDYKWVPFDFLLGDVKENPEIYTYWFREIINKGGVL